MTAAPMIVFEICSWAVPVEGFRATRRLLSKSHYGVLSSLFRWSPFFVDPHIRASRMLPAVLQGRAKWVPAASVHKLRAQQQPNPSARNKDNNPDADFPGVTIRYLPARPGTAREPAARWHAGFGRRKYRRPRPAQFDVDGFNRARAFRRRPEPLQSATEQTSLLKNSGICAGAAKTGCSRR